MHVYAADDAIVNQIAERIRRHADAMSGMRPLDRWEWEEINRRGWRMNVEGKEVMVVLDPPELSLALKRASEVRR